MKENLNNFLCDSRDGEKGMAGKETENKMASIIVQIHKPMTWVPLE